MMMIKDYDYEIEYSTDPINNQINLLLITRKKR